jgi:hypothetical protein
MLMLLMAFVFTIGVFAIVFPDSSIGQFVAGLFVRREDKPLSLAKIIALVVACLMVTAFVTAFPLDLVLLADVTAYTEMAAAIMIVVSQVRLRQLLEGVGSVVSRMRPKLDGLIRAIRKGVRARRVRRPTLPGKDGSDSDGAGLVFA